MKGKQRPQVSARAVADQYSAAGQRIVEFTFPSGEGGLISLATSPDGTPVVFVYRADPSIVVGYAPPSGGRITTKRRPYSRHVMLHATAAVKA